jgi:hypothetical protein
MIVLDIVRYCKVCGRLEDHECHNMLMPTPDSPPPHVPFHEFEPDIPWDWDGHLYEEADWGPTEVALYERMKAPLTFRLDCSKPNQANVPRCANGDVFHGCECCDGEDACSCA